MGAIGLLLLLAAVPLSLALQPVILELPRALQKNALSMSVNATKASLGEGAQLFASHFGKPDSKQRAARFEGPKCQQLKASADLRKWARSATPSVSSGATTLHWSLERKVTYVRNKKAGSTFMIKHMSDLFHARDIELGVARLKLYDQDEKLVNTKVKGLDVGQDWSVFTVVREPIETALDAYLEVSLNFARGGESVLPTPDFVDMPCDTEAQATKRFKMYLQTAAAGKRLSDIFDHSYPQALKLDIELLHPDERDHTFDNILRVEDMQHEFQEIPSFVGSLPKRDSDHSNKGRPCAKVDWEDPELMASLCKMYRVDYECFGYSLPAACRRSSG